MTEQSRSNNAPSQLVQIETNNGGTKLVWLHDIREIDLPRSMSRNDSTKSNTTSTDDCLVHMHHGSTFEIPRNHTNQFLGQLNALGVYSPQSINKASSYEPIESTTTGGSSYSTAGSGSSSQGGNVKKSS